MSGGRDNWRRKLLNAPTIPGISLGVALGAAIGVGAYTFVYAKGYSYLSNDPAACANCHVMQEQYDSWLKSSHLRQARRRRPLPHRRGPPRGDNPADERGG